MLLGTLYWTDELTLAINLINNIIQNHIMPILAMRYLICSMGNGPKGSWQDGHSLTASSPSKNPLMHSKQTD